MWVMQSREDRADDTSSSSVHDKLWSFFGSFVGLYPKICDIGVCNITMIISCTFICNTTNTSLLIAPKSVRVMLNILG